MRISDWSSDVCSSDLLALLARWLLTREGTTLWTSPMLILIAAISLLVSFGFDLGSWYLSDLSPEMSGQGAIVYAFLSLQGILTGISLLMRSEEHSSELRH